MVATLDNKDLLLPNLPRHTEHNLSNIFVTDWEVSSLIKSLDPEELLPIFAKRFLLLLEGETLSMSVESVKYMPSFLECG